MCALRNKGLHRSISERERRHIRRFNGLRDCMPITRGAILSARSCCIYALIHPCGLISHRAAKRIVEWLENESTTLRLEAGLRHIQMEEKNNKRDKIMREDEACFVYHDYLERLGALWH